MLVGDDIEREAEQHRLRDTFGGYDWGDPVRLFYRRPGRVFTDRQLEVARRALEDRFR